MSGINESRLILDALYVGIEVLGFDTNLIMEKAGVTEDEVNGSVMGHRRKVSYEVRCKLLEALIDVSQDNDIGLHLGIALPLNFGLVIEYFFLSSASFEEALTRLGKYDYLISDTFRARADLLSDPCCIQTVFYDEDTAEDLHQRHFNESMLVHHLRLYQMATGGEFQPVKVFFMHSEPEDISEHEAVFGCPVEFSHSTNSIYFPRKYLSIKSPMAQPELLVAHENMVAAQLDDIEQKDSLVRTKTVITELLETGELNLETVAAKLAVEPAQLRRRLAKHGTTFTVLLNEHRHALAKQLLIKTDEALESIVYLLGFVEISSFYKAFKRWEGVTPAQYRKKYLKSKVS